jgi:hypothetical protein
MSLTITFDRTEGGLYRAEVAEHPRHVIEHADLSALVAEPKRNLDFLAVTPDGKLLLGPSRTGDDTADAAARAEVERTTLRNEELDELIEQYPVPVEWGEEPGWSDAL